MQGRIFTGGVGACAAIACCFLIPSTGNGASERRGGDHSCNPDPVAGGTFYEDGFWGRGDKVVFGFRFQPGTPDQDEISSRNTNAANEDKTTGLSCSGAPGAWKEVTSNLGPDDDSVRLDARGLEVGPEEIPFRKLPKEITSVLRGGGGDDTIRGHKGFDNINGGRGDDVIKADDDKKDVVKCGPGEDKADVDSKDDVFGCEKET